MSDLSIHSLTFDFPVDTVATGWQTALQRAPRLRVESPEIEGVKFRTTSIHPPRPGEIKVKSFAFADIPGWLQAKPVAGAEKPAVRSLVPIAEGESAAKPRKTITRIKPPGDVVKLSDRLYYLLQPALESLIRGRSLDMPFHPFPYQLEGIAFLYPRHAAILADEMGLGKTMQAVSTIRLLLHALEARSVLLVCPKPLVTNWQREFGLWAPEVPLTVIEGDQATRRWKWGLADVPVKIANYELLMRDRELLEDESLKFDLVVLDEAQRIKNRSSTTSQVVRSIHRTRSWAVTGTPVENHPEDLVGIFEFLSPGYLRPEMTAKKLGKAVGDYIIRRTKDMVQLDLPPKMIRDAELSLSPNQLASYKMAEDEGIVQLNNLGDEITVQHVFELVLRLKQICNYDPLTGDSAKLERLEADLEEVAESGKKAIVFSQWVKTLDFLDERLQRFGPLAYHGRIPSAKRDPILKQFKEDKTKHVLLMSYGAGSVGLNLQFCGYVFLFDRWWNPAIEDQAINRAHRIGASGPVTVTRFITLDSIEERINEVLEHKRQLFDAVLSEAGGNPSDLGLSQAEIFGLFDLRSPKGRIHKAA